MLTFLIHSSERGLKQKFSLMIILQQPFPSLLLSLYFQELDMEYSELYEELLRKVKDRFYAKIQLYKNS